MTTIKERMLDDLRELSDDKGRVSLDALEMTKRFGLNGHDLYKNLDQLRKEGHIELKASGDRIESVRLKIPRKASMTKRILSWLRQAPGGDLGVWSEVSIGQLADQMHERYASVAPAVSAMLKDGRLEARRKGVKITALRVTPKGQVKETVRVGVVGGVPVEQVITYDKPNYALSTAIPPTPELDKYVAARRIARLAPEDNKYLHVQFEDNAIAEEALLLREALWKAVTGKGK